MVESGCNGSVKMWMVSDANLDWTLWIWSSGEMRRDEKDRLAIE